MPDGKGDHPEELGSEQPALSLVYALIITQNSVFVKGF